MSENLCCVGGVFDTQGGRPSGYFAKLSGALAGLLPAAARCQVVNGGSWDSVASLQAEVASQFDWVLWAADVPNSHPKLVNKLKEANPTLMLVITKNNRENKYTRAMLTARALQAKANLLVEFQRDAEGRVLASVIDPLGNCFIERTPDVGELARVLVSRLSFLARMTRVGSRSVGECPVFAPETAEQAFFFALVRQYAQRFHALIHIDDNGRMLGNLSFRCENGFPSLRHEAGILVSRRNVDKRDIGLASMVPVKVHTEGVVEYLGDQKPSVDTPIQRCLYARWPAARYMLHAHVYIDGAQFTETVVPCGALEEADEIFQVMPDYDGQRVAYINLRGHGSLAVASRVAMLGDIPYIERPLV